MQDNYHTESCNVQNQILVDTIFLSHLSQTARILIKERPKFHMHLDTMLKNMAYSHRLNCFRFLFTHRSKNKTSMFTWLKHSKRETLQNMKINLLMNTKIIYINISHIDYQQIEINSL